MAYFFKLAGYDYDEPRDTAEIVHEDDGIGLYVSVFAKTKNEEVPHECREVSPEQTDGIFLRVQSLQELAGRKLVGEEYRNECGCAGALNVIAHQPISNKAGSQPDKGTALCCPQCGASFDTRNVKACPFCSNAYLHEEHDWVMTDLQ